MGEGSSMKMPKDEEADHLDMPPGFRFHPTDAEIIIYYLVEKVSDHSFTSLAIGEIDLNTCEPWDLPGRAKMGENEWFFFWQRDRKYPTGTRTNRATESGYWKATGKDKEIYKGKGCLVGMKKTLVFYLGRAPKGEKTNWVMHEYRLEGRYLLNHMSRPSKNDWVVCKVFHKNEPKINNMEGDMSRNCSTLDTSFGVDLMHSYTLPPLLDSPPPYTHNIPSGSVHGNISWFTQFDQNPNQSFASQYSNINPLLLDMSTFQSDPNPTLFPGPDPSTQLPSFDEQVDLEYLHPSHNVETKDALKGKCKIEEQPLTSHSPETGPTIDSGSRSWDDPGSPLSLVGPLADLQNYMWN